MARLQFEFELVAEEDPKSNTIIMKTITDKKQKRFYIPQDYQAYKLHPELIKLTEFKKVAKTLQKREQCRKVWIRPNDEILKLYRDESGNMTFKNFLLQDISIREQNVPSTSAKQVDETLIQLLEKWCDIEKPPKESNCKNLNKVCEKFVLDNFERKKISANQWLQIYESE